MAGDGKRNIRENARVGKEAEKKALAYLRAHCESVKRTGKGSDFEARGCRDGVRDGLYEVKSGNAPLTPRQRKTQRAHGPGFTVFRVRDASARSASKKRK